MSGQLLSSPYLALLQMGFTKPTSHLAAGELLPHRFTLTISGGLISVALSLGFPPLGVTKHPALWSPDFPQKISFPRLLSSH